MRLLFCKHGHGMIKNSSIANKPEAKMDIYYLDNSGFAMIENDTLLLFDVYNFTEKPEKQLFQEGFVEERELSTFARVYVFVSHIHGDHFNEKIFRFAQENENTFFVLEKDVPASAQISYVKLSEKDVFADDYLRVTAWPSTDIGVSFQVEFAGKTIFHAGDLNYWHWQEESTQEEIKEAYEMYMDAIEMMQGNLYAPDVAFFPVDPRMGSDIGRGAHMFIEAFHPKALIPMHFSNDFACLKAFQEEVGGKTHVYLPTRRGDLIQIKEHNN
jgi:L-ascorbate metabolism protein UlaG (beta-lactamase superfamily)